MYVKTKCSKCGQTDYQNIRLHVTEDLYRKGSTYEYVHTLDEVTITETISEEQLARDILLELEGYVYNGMTTDEFCKLLKKYFGVASKYCCDLIQRMKIDLDMYCPDRQHLYFVEKRTA
ncbi:hypothetical protein [Methanococcoides sp. AM1]|uniref:hypothetical protein n=1 Tax=Methanococcoides sp. AM1 TaxID=1201011 RepID=UPI001083D6EB|nr:hypothetical protein [Methanococcoides sp. AM1]